MDEFERNIYEEQVILFVPSGELVTIPNQVWEHMFHRDERIYDNSNKLNPRWDNKVSYWVIRDRKRWLFNSILEQINKSTEYNYQSPIKDKVFLKFLKDNNIYNKFINNCKKDKEFKEKYWHNLADFSKNLNRHNYMTRAFMWDKTKEGSNFWSRYNSDWNNYAIRYGEKYGWINSK